MRKKPVRFGVCLFPLQFISPKSDLQTQTEKIIEAARLSEECHLDSYWVIDHLLTALDRYRLPVLEPLILLSVLSARTTSIRMGTSILIMPLRNPILLAKELATLDVLSSGRLTLGAAAGWCKEEFDVCGIPFHKRGKMFDEQLAILKRLWAEDNLTYKGNFFSFSNVTIEPKPVQKPGLPIWVGAEDLTLEAPLKRIVTLGDGWLGVTSPRHYKEGLGRIDELAHKVGRDPESLETANFTYTMVDSNSDVARQKAREVLDQVHSQPVMQRVERLLIAGTPEEVASKIQNQINAGVRYVILNLLSNDPQIIPYVSEKVLPKIDANPD